MSAEIRFYHLERQSLEQVLPVLLSKSLATERRVVIKAANAAEVERLNTYLWAYHPEHFLPHGSAKDGHASEQPIWLTTKDENPNGAVVLILVQGVQSAILDQFDLCCDVFDGRGDEDLAAARVRWSAYKEAAHEMSYWQQGAAGWEKKA